ncbi:hypothetical protein [Rhizobium mulingense]|uniref:hypothetical protein n=1 Tax=Rhizobium mulingense TaxID=3031128 RepID=UPI002B469CDE|nr:hypothetical protein [Rhizobium sp. MJ21]MEB3046530.1 hypothetical protein [Rhizobium sp. MJ21]
MVKAQPKSISFSTRRHPRPCATTVRFKYPFLKSFPKGYGEISVYFTVRDVGTEGSANFASELSATPMPPASIPLIAKIISQNSKAAHLPQVSETSATAFAKSDSSGTSPRMTEGLCLAVDPCLQMRKVTIAFDLDGGQRAFGKVLSA